MSNYFSAVTRNLQSVSPATVATWALAAIGAATLLYALTSLALPFGWDHGIIASAGSAYLHGGVPYLDSWDMKGPTAYIPFALAEFLFGTNMWGIRLLDALAWGLAGYVLYKGVRPLTTWRIAVGIALTTYLWIASAGWFFSAAPESWVTVSFILAITPMLVPAPSIKLRTIFLSGALIACAGLVKPFYFGLGLAPLLAVALAQDLSIWRRVQQAAVLAAGALTPVLLVAGYFALHGGLAQAIEVHLLYPLSTYAGEGAGISGILGGVLSFFKLPVIIAVPFVAFGLWTQRKQTRLAAILLAWLGMAFVCVALQGKFFTYHWFPSYPPLFVLAGMGVHALLRQPAKSTLITAFALGCSALVLLAVVARPLREFARYGYYVGLKQDSDAYYGSFDFRLYNAGNEIALARYLDAHTAPEDKVFVWGSDGAYFLADRANATRFTFAMPLTMPGRFRDPYRAEAMRDLSAAPPRYFVVGIAWDGLSKADTEMVDFPEMVGFLNDNYSLEHSIGDIDIYRRRDAAAPASDN